MTNEQVLDALYEIRRRAIANNRQDHAETLARAIEIIGEQELLYENIKSSNEHIEELEAKLKQLQGQN